MNIQLRGPKAFWMSVGLALALTLALLLLWALPMRAAARNAQAEWERQVMILQGLQMNARRIPSLESLKDLTEYRQWLDAQAKLVESFFADRASALEAPLTGEGEFTPAAFKDAYIDAVKTQRRWLESHKEMAFADIGRAFATYEWTRRAELFPKPDEYLDVLRGYWGRLALYRIFLQEEVKLVKRVELGKAVPFAPEFEAIPLQIDVSLPPEKVISLVDRLLSVSPSASGKPVIKLERMTVAPDPSGGAKLCSVQLDGQILLLRRPRAGTKEKGPTP